MWLDRMRRGRFWFTRLLLGFVRWFDEFIGNPMLPDDIKAQGFALQSGHSPISLTEAGKSQPAHKVSTISSPSSVDGFLLKLCRDTFHLHAYQIMPRCVQIRLYLFSNET